MKKFALFIAMAAFAVAANAQKKTLIPSKPLDNLYVGMTAGAETSLKGEDPFGVFNSSLSLFIGKNFDPIFGVRLDAEANFENHKLKCKYSKGYTFVRLLDIDLLGTVNFMNLILGYQGEPRMIEVSGLYGFGWSHGFGKPSQANAINSKVGLDISYNFGKHKEFQAFFEPSIIWKLQSYSDGLAEASPSFQYDANVADLELKAGIIYKLKNSYGKHNFSYELLREQSEIDDLNSKINGLRSDLDKAYAATAAANAKTAEAEAQIAELQKKLSECQNAPLKYGKGNLQVAVIFALNSSVVYKSQMANIELVAQYMKKNPNARIKISGYATPEGKTERNLSLSEKRAEKVKDILVKQYGISADRLETAGLGMTDKLFDELEFNRVVLFNDITK